MPAAEAAEAALRSYFPHMNELGKCIANSLCTLLVQMIVGYTAFMINEVRTNREKYLDGDGVSFKKVAVGFGKAVKAFLSFDIPYSLGKISLQSYFLWTGKDPWKASGIADGIAAPLWIAVAIPLGLHNNIFDTRETRSWSQKAI